MPNIIDDTQAAAIALDGPGLARALIGLVDRIADWDESADSWPCDCGAEALATTLADLDRLNAHDPSCPYRMYFELRALAGALHLRLTGEEADL